MSWKVTTQANQKIWGYGKKSQSCQHKKKKKEHRHTRFELTSLLHCHNPANHVKHGTVPQKATNKVQGTKTRQSVLSKRIWAALCLSWDRFFNSSLLDSDVIRQRWQMWHDSSAWEAAVTTDRKLLTAQCVTRGSLSEKKQNKKKTVRIPTKRSKG